MDFSKVTDIVIPEGNVIKITDTNNTRTIWRKSTLPITYILGGGSWWHNQNNKPNYYAVNDTNFLTEGRKIGATKFRIHFEDTTVQTTNTTSLVESISKMTYGYEEGIGGSSATADIRLYTNTNETPFLNVTATLNDTGYLYTIPAYTSSTWLDIDTDTANSLFGILFAIPANKTSTGYLLSFPNIVNMLKGLKVYIECDK